MQYLILYLDIIKGRYFESLMQIIKGKKKNCGVIKFQKEINHGCSMKHLEEKTHFIETYNLYLMLISEAVVRICTKL